MEVHTDLPGDQLFRTLQNKLCQLNFIHGLIFPVTQCFYGTIYKVKCMQVCETAVHLKMFNGQKTSLNSVKLSTQKAKGTQDWAKGHLCNLKSILLYVCTQHDTVFSHYSKPIFVFFCFVFLIQVHPIQSTSLTVCSISKMIFWFTLLFTTWPQTAVSYSTPFLRDKLLHRLVSKTPQPSLQQHLPKTQFRGNHL